MISVDRILKPLARLAIRKGWLFGEMEKRLKRAYVDAAISLCEGAATDSRISIMTGLQRRDIASIRKAPERPLPKRQPLAEIIALWRHDPEYSLEELPFKGDGASFTTLARRIRQDVHPRTYLDLLIESGAVEEMADHVSLKTIHYRPLSGSDDQLAYLTENVGDHLSVAVTNVLDGDKNYEMAVHYEGLSEAAIAELNSMFRQSMQETLQKLDTRARDLPSSEDGPHRFRAGGYFFDDRNRGEA